MTNAQERHLLPEEEFIAGFHAIGEENTKALAQKTGLCVSTIYRLQRALVSPDTHIGTIQALARAAGLQLVFTKNGRVFMEAA